MTGYPQIGFNPYSMYENWGYGYQYPAFRGVQNVPQPVSVPQPNVNLQTPPDTVSFKATEHIQTKPKKEGLSTGAKWGLGALALAGIGTAVCFATRGKVGAKSAQQLAENIEFKPAKTVEEAKKFAQEKLNVLYNDIDDVGTVNFINEWLTGIRNNPKLGKEYYPRIIYKSDCRGSFYCLTNKEAIINGKNYGYALGVNTERFTNFKSNLNSIMDEIVDVTSNKHLFKKVANGYDIAQPELNTPFVRKLLDRVNKSNLDNLSYKEKWSIYDDLIAIQEGKIVDGKLVEQKRSLHTYLNYELGHLVHNKSISNYDELAKVEELKERGKEISPLVKEFKTDKAHQATAGKVSYYAKESPLEFVAETFAGLLDGKTYSDDVMALYKKYGGPALT